MAASQEVVERTSFEKLLLAVPAYWPVEFARQVKKRRGDLPRDWLSYVREATAISFPPKPGWVTPHTVFAETRTMWLRDFSDADAPAGTIPVIIDAPYAGHPSTVADYADGQSLVQTLKAAGCKRLYVTDWKSATRDMRHYGIDKYLADLEDMVDAVGGQAHLVGLCQGGWLSTMLAARFPHKVKSLVLAGAPIDTHAGNGPVTRLGRRTPFSYYQGLVAMGGGLLRGKFMLAAWKSMHPDDHYWGKYIDLFDNITNPEYRQRARHFASWYEHTVDLPGRLYLEAVKQLFKLNRLARGEFIALGERISLRKITVPVYLLAGEDDDITTPDQVFNAEALLGTPKDQVIKELAPGGHIGLFMGAKTLKNQWVRIGEWIGRQK